MKYLLFALGLQLAQCSALGGQITYSIRVATNGLHFKAGYGDAIELSTGKLFYELQHGVKVPTDDTYLVENINGYPRIINVLDGHDVTLQLTNIDHTNKRQLRVFFHTGASQYGVRLYKVNGMDIVPLSTQPVNSNMGSVKVNGMEIVVKNQECNNDGTITICTDTYKVVGDNCKLLREEKVKVANNETTNSTQGK